MEALKPKLTSVGLRAVFNASNTGLDAAITHIAFGDGGAGGGYLPTGNETALKNERVRVPVGGGERVSDFQIQVQALLEGSEQFWIKELAFILEDGTHLAVWSDPEKVLAYKTAGVPLAVAYDLALSGVPANSVTIVTSGPQVNLTIGGPLAQLSAEILRLQRRVVESEIARTIPLFSNRWS